MGSALPIIGGTLGLYSAGKSASAQKRAANAASGVAKNQNQLFKQTTPYYGAILDYLAQNAGIQLPQAQTPGGAATPANPALGSSPLPAGSGALPDSFLGIFGQNEQDRLALGQAEDDLGRIRERRDQQLRHRLGQRGAGEATISSALAQNEGDYMTQLAAFRRSLALAARQEQERRVAQLLGALNPGLGAGQAAAGTFGNQANMYGNQASAAGAGVGSFLSNWLLADAMRRQGGQGIAPGEQDPWQAYLMGRGSMF